MKYRMFMLSTAVILLTGIPIAWPAAAADPDPRPATLVSDPDRPRVAFSRLPVVALDVDTRADQGPLELWRHSVGHGGVNSEPLPERVVAGTAKLQPRLIRIFIQEFFRIYPEHGTFDWSRLDPYMDSFARTGAKVVAAITIKPKPLFPQIDPGIWRPTDVREWQQVIAALVQRYSVDRPIVTHWEIGNETDIGENGGCPYLIPEPQDYLEYYRMTAQPILTLFPKAKVGGCAVAMGGGDYLPRFIELCRQQSVQLDFISWHLYSDDSTQHAALVKRYRQLLEPFGAKRPEMMVTEWSKGFEPVSVEEMAFAPRRAALTAAAILAMHDAGLDWSFYYHLRDQSARWSEFQPFFRDPNIMYHHWNEVPHRFGLFGVNQEVRPQYFVFQLLGKLGRHRLQATCESPDLRILAGRHDDGTAGVVIVNCDRTASTDRVTEVRFSGLAPGRRSLTVFRIDHQRSWSNRSLELRPTERREVDVRERFAVQVYTPGDSVSLVALETTAAADAPAQ
jgi:hypothetical protein